MVKDFYPDNMVDAAVTTDDMAAHAKDDLFSKFELRFAEMETFWSPIHDEGRQDDMFVAGDQWEEQIKKEREEQGRPFLTYNLLPTFTRQIINSVRQNPPQIRVVPVEMDKPDVERFKGMAGNKDYSHSDVIMGIIRNIEQVSRADQAKLTALQHAVDHGFGFMEVANRYNPHDPFTQELVIKRIKDAYSVYLDPSAEEVDYSDAQDAVRFRTISKASFEKFYPNATTGSAGPGSSSLNHQDWWSTDNVRVADYYYIEHRQDEVLKLSDGRLVYLSDVESILDEMERDLGVFVATDASGKEYRRKIKRPVVMKAAMSGHEVLSDPVELPFEHIPIVPVLGNEVTHDGGRIIMYESAIRHSRDPQRSYNYWRTAGAETVALVPKTPWIVDNKAIKGHEHLWERANAENLPYLPYNAQEGVAPPSRVFNSSPAVAELSNANQDARDIQTIIGLYEANLGAESNEKSGKAIVARQNQGAVSTFTFPDNLNRALEHVGRLLVTGIQRIYDTERIMRIRLPDDAEDFVEINKTIVDEQTGRSVLVNDIGYGRYDVVIETGPSFATQRQEAVDTQLKLLDVMPEQMRVFVLHLIAKNLAIPGSEDIAEQLRKLLPDTMKTDDEREADLPDGVVIGDQGQPVDEATGEPWQPPLPPEVQAQVQAQQQQADIEQQKLQAEAAKAQADQERAQIDLQKSGMDLEKTRLETEAKNSEADARRAKAESERLTAQAVAMRAQADIASIQAEAQEAGVDMESAQNLILTQVETMIEEAMGRNEETSAKNFSDILSKGLKDIEEQIRALKEAA